MTNFVEAKELQYQYQIKDENGEVCRTVDALAGIDLEIAPGEFIAILGANGSGKSTLARHLNALLHPVGGTLYIDGKDASLIENELPIRKAAGMVFQNPDNQLVAGVVEEDVAFGPENIGVPTEEIEKRVTESLQAVGMRDYRYHSPNHLSGGQKQRIAIAGVLAMHPKCIIFDESTAMLDPAGRKEVLEAAHERNRRDNVTIIWITHFMEEAASADRIYVMDAGHIVLTGTPREVFARDEMLSALGLELPAVTRLAKDLKTSGLPLSDTILKREQLTAELLKTKEAFGGFVQGAALPVSGADDMDLMDVASSKEKEEARILLEAKKVSFTYGSNSPYRAQALHAVDLQLKKGSFHALIGPTGSGKSTLVQILGGLQRPERGHIFLEGEDIYGQNFSKKKLRSRLGLVFQYPEYQLFETTVLRDVAFGPGNLGYPEDEAKEKAICGLRAAGVEERFWEQSPFELSGGEKRRVAIAGVLAMDPEILIMDEPTAGLDPAGRRDLFALLTSLNQEQGITILLVSHSMDDVAECADQITVLQKGEVHLTGSPELVFREKTLLEKMNLALPEAAAIAQELSDCGITVGRDVYTYEGLLKALGRNLC